MKWLLCTLATLFVSASAISTRAQSEGLSGSDLYRFYCAGCHGLHADGSGPMAPILLVQPTDLTKLAAQNDGVFPRWRVIRRIDGQDPLLAHGSDMPVFGPWFESPEFETTVDLASGQSVTTSQPIADLVLYLESIQVK